ncbi:hypothetical protein [Sphingomonas pruni]|uniref:hypothetical protein n=1 Tax=Sphingomonas pruni TaxID=40683 RepID=UPI0008357A61|nr:hypothetical protein [Sphingomonas pruni]
MSNKMLIFIGPDQAFDTEAVDRIIGSLAGCAITRLGARIGAVQQYLVAQESDELIVRISSDMETVTIDGPVGHLSALIALSLQAGLSFPIHVTDMGYNFDLPISGFASAEALLSAMSS